MKACRIMKRRQKIQNVSKNCKSYCITHKRLIEAIYSKFKIFNEKIDEICTHIYSLIMQIFKNVKQKFIICNNKIKIYAANKIYIMQIKG